MVEIQRFFDETPKNFHVRKMKSGDVKELPLFSRRFSSEMCSAIAVASFFSFFR